jgi:flagellar biosynthesis/type III secretory pathway protein FliH
MKAGTYEYKSDFARRYYQQGQTQGRAEGLTEGLTEGRAEGLTEGLTEGRAEGEVRALLAILNARGIPVSDAAHTRITSCTDLDQLDVWVRRAITAPTIQDLFND